MRWGGKLFFVLVLWACANLRHANFGQDNVPTLRADSKSAFVWGNDVPNGAVSSTIEDPLTGRTLFKLSYARVDVSSRMGFERAGRGRAGEFLEYTTTIANGSASAVFVRYGGISIDGYLASPPVLVTKKKGLAGHDEQAAQIVNLTSLICFSSGFLASENILSADRLSKVFTVAPGTMLSVSSLVKDPRNYSVRCSVEGCYPIGMIRYYVNIGGHDYVFLWPGRSVPYCGG